MRNDYQGMYFFVADHNVYGLCTREEMVSLYSRDTIVGESIVLSRTLEELGTVGNLFSKITNSSNVPFPSSLGTLEDVRKNYTVDKTVLDELHKSLHPSCVGIARFDTKKIENCLRHGEEWKKIPGISSGTAVKIGNHLFIATAKHVIEDDDDFSHYHLCAKNRRELLYSSLSKPIRKLNCPLVNNRDIDVGLLEYDLDKFSNEYDDIRPIDISRIRLPHTDRTMRRHALLGYPSECLETGQNGQKVWTGCKSMIYGTVPKDDSESGQYLGGNSSEANYDPSIHIILGLIQTAEIAPSKCIESPVGMSGGGLWDYQVDDREKLWTPEESYLVGIQSAWDEENRLLKVIQIQHWLKLVYDNYEDLQEDIRTSIPGFAP